MLGSLSSRHHDLRGYSELCSPMTPGTQKRRWFVAMIISNRIVSKTRLRRENEVWQHTLYRCRMFLRLDTPTIGNASPWLTRKVCKYSLSRLLYSCKRLSTLYPHLEIVTSPAVHEEFESRLYEQYLPKKSRSTVASLKILSIGTLAFHCSG